MEIISQLVYFTIIEKYWGLQIITFLVCISLNLFEYNDHSGAQASDYNPQTTFLAPLLIESI